MNKKKYATGGDIVRNYIESPDEALVKNNLAMARAQQKSNNNPLAMATQVLGSLAMSYGSSMEGGDGGAANIMAGINSIFASGGTVKGQDVNVEGKEVIETPDGSVQEISGPSHENGGVDMTLPFGTEVFSKRLTGPDGKTMAERKKYRENKLSKLESLIKKNPTDSTLKKTLEKTKRNFATQEQFDISKMNFAKSLAQGVNMMATGGSVGFPPLDLSFLDAVNNINFGNGSSDDFHLDGTTSYTTNPSPQQTSIDFGAIDNTFSNPTITDDASLQSGGNQDYVASTPTGDVVQNTNGTPTWAQALSNVFSGGTGLTMGDMIGLAGDVDSTFSPMKNTLEARAGDQPNINAYKDFGQDALRAIEDAKGYVAGQKDKALQDAEGARSGMIRRNRNSARSVNTQRALDIAASMATNQQEASIYDNFTRQMQALFSQQAQAENQQDSMVMAGEQAKDLADRQDRDNFFSQIAEDIATRGEGLRKTGRDLNQVKTRNTTQTTLNQMYDNFKIDVMTGKIKSVAKKDIQENGDKYMSLGIDGETYRNNIVPKISSGEWKWDGDILVDKNGNEIDLTTI